MAGIIIRRGTFGHKHTGKISCEDRERNWREASVSQETPGVTRSWKK